MLSEINKRLCELILSRISKFLKTIEMKYFLFAVIAITSIKCDLQVLEVDITFALLNLYIFPFISLVLNSMKEMGEHTEILDIWDACAELVNLSTIR